MEKNEFNIPKNFNAKFEIVKGWGLKEILVMIPPIGFTYLFDVHTPFSPLIKVIVSIFSILIPFMLIHLRPKRNNIHAMKHLKWRIEYLSRQKAFHYRKEGIKK